LATAASSPSASPLVSSTPNDSSSFRLFPPSMFRSWNSILDATRQPSFSGPISWLGDSWTSSKNSWQKCAPPVTSLIGVTVTPGLRTGIMNIDSPPCLGTSMVVRASTIA
jgi:hypothetical protein